MAISVNPATYVIYVPKADLAVIQTVPVEIRELNSNTFRIWLDDWMDSEAGIVMPKTHNHNGEVVIDGLTYARTIEILSPYTVEFEDGMYQVNIVGSNNNIHSRRVVNSVSLVPNNSAGLISSAAMEFSSYQGTVMLDVVNGVAGTLYPTGTYRQPVNNIADALLIASVRGLEEITFRGSLTLTTGEDVSGLTIVGDNAITSMLTINTGALCASTRFRDLFVMTSVLDGQFVYFDHCAIVGGVTNWIGFAENCLLANSISIGTGSNTYFVDCKSGCVGLGAADLPVLDMTGASTRSIAFRNWAGPIKVTNATAAASTVCIDIASGATITIDATCTAGTMYVRGVGNIVNNGSMTVHHEGHLDAPDIADYVQTNLMSTTIPVNISRVNNIVVDGLGTELNPWGPV